MFSRRLAGVSVLLMAWGFARPALAWPPTWGAELTFTSPAQETVNHGKHDMTWSEENQEALEAFHAVAKKKAKGRSDIASVKLVEEGDKWSQDLVRVTYTDGFFFEVTMDPNCLEVMLRPFTLEELRPRIELLQRDLFGWMKEAGLEPKRDIGGGHLHMGAEAAFGDDVHLFRNWLVDHANHSELASGALELDDDNTAPLVKMNKAQREAFKALLQRVDRGLIKTVRQLATEFAAKVLFEGKPATGKRIMLAKYYAINILRMANLDTWDTLEPNERWYDYEAWILFDEVPKKARTAETRNLRTQMSARHLLEDVELLEGRMNYLKNLTEDLQLSKEFMAGKRIKGADGARAFFRYVMESGRDPAVYLERLPQKGDAGLRDWKAWRDAYQKLMKSCPAKVAR